MRHRRLLRAKAVETSRERADLTAIAAIDG